MTTVKFRNIMVNDGNHGVTLERAIRVYANAAGIHDFQFEPIVNDVLGDIDDWTVINGTWQHSVYGRIEGKSSGGTPWQLLLHDSTEIPREGIIELDVAEAGDAGVVFRADDSDNYYLFFWWDIGTVGFLKYVGGVPTTLSKISTGILATNAHIIVAFREAGYTAYDEDVELMMSAWIDGRHVLTARDELDINDPPGTMVGLAVYASQSTYAQFDNIRVPDLARFAEWMSLDPGENPAGGLSRAMGKSSHIKMFARHDGSLYAWKPRDSSSLLTIVQNDQITLRRERDNRKVVTHVRILGGWEEAEVFRSDLYANYGHRFEEVVNDNLLSAEECYSEGEQYIRKTQEEADQITITGPMLVLLEPEDHITIQGIGDYIVTEISATGSQAELALQARCRRYISS